MSGYFDDNKATDDHGRQSLRSGTLTIAARALNAVIQIGSVLFLARLLSPEDYGLVGMVMAITGFASVFVDLGTRDAVVQRTQITEAEVSALFWITMGVGLSATALTAASAPWIAGFYNEPRLVPITLACSLGFLTSALTCQPYALLRRRMQFGLIGFIETGANVISTVGAIAMAFWGLGYWALILKPLTGTLLTAVGVWSACRWVPVQPAITPGVKEMLRFGLNLTGFTMTDFAGRSSDRVAIGYRSGAIGLGYYQNTRFVYDNLLDVLVIPVHAVAVSSLSKLRDNPPELHRLWAKALSTLAFFAMPAFGLLAVTSQDLISLILGERWAPAGLLLSVLALRGIPHSVERTLGWLHVTAGRTDRWMRWGVFAAIVHLVALLCGLPFGPLGVCIAYVLCMFALFIPAVAYAGEPLGIGSVAVWKAVGPQLVGALGAAAVGFGLRYSWLLPVGPFERTVGVGLAYVAVYLALVAGVLNVRAPLSLVGSLVWSGARGKLRNA